MLLYTHITTVNVIKYAHSHFHVVLFHYIVKIAVFDYSVRHNYGNQGLMKRYKFNSLSAINLTRG